MGLVEFCEEKLGLSYVETDSYVSFDSESRTIHAPDLQWFLHEVCHWLSSPPDQRDEPNYGLVLGLDEDRERMACLLERLFHQNAETDFIPTLDSKNNDYFLGRWRKPSRKEHCWLGELVRRLKAEFGEEFWDELVEHIRSENFAFSRRSTMVTVK